MKALTISQPFATLIASGDKFVENRRWGTNYRGPLAIHAGKGGQYLEPTELRQYPTGCVVALVRLAACMPFASMLRMNRSRKIPSTVLTIGDVMDHEHTEGPWCWVVVDREPLPEPVQAKGAQGLWDWTGGCSVCGYPNMHTEKCDRCAGTVTLRS